MTLASTVFKESTFQNCSHLNALGRHTKSQGHWPSGSGEDFKGFLPYMGMVTILVM